MRRTKLFITAGAVAALGAGGAAIAGASSDDDARERPIQGSELTRASEAARAEVPGKVTGTEKGDEEGAYEVEITRPDGSQVDVHLDARFEVIDTRDDADDDE